MGWYRVGGPVDVLELSKDVKPEDIAAFVSEAHYDVDMHMQSNLVVLKWQGQEHRVPLGSWLVRDRGYMQVYDKDTFEMTHDLMRLGG